MCSVHARHCSLISILQKSTAVTSFSIWASHEAGDRQPSRPPAQPLGRKYNTALYVLLFVRVRIYVQHPFSLGDVTSYPSRPGDGFIVLRMNNSFLNVFFLPRRVSTGWLAPRRASVGWLCLYLARWLSGGRTNSKSDIPAAYCFIYYRCEL